MGERTGIGSYTAHLIEAFAGLAPEDEFALFTDRPMDLPGPNFSNPVVKMPKRIVWTYYSLPRELRKHRLDLFHGTTNFELPPTRSCRLVSTVHDLIPLRFPEFVSKKSNCYRNIESFVWFADVRMIRFDSEHLCHTV